MLLLDITSLKNLPCGRLVRRFSRGMPLCLHDAFLVASLLGWYHTLLISYEEVPWRAERDGVMRIGVL
jgi:hypothetical protein